MEAYHQALLDNTVQGDYPNAGDAEHVSASNQRRPSPSNQWHEARCRCQHRWEFLGSSQIDELHDPVYVSLLGGNIQAGPLPSIRLSQQRTTAGGHQNELHTAATPPTTATKEVHNTLGNNVYISSKAKPIWMFVKA